MATIWITGASSFTAFHLVHELSQRGHNVVVSCSRSHDDYSGVQAERLNGLPSGITLFYDTPLGSERMLEEIQRMRLDAFCHHGSWTRGLQTDAFDLNRAIIWNTHNVPKVIQSLSDTGCQHILYTNSYFVQSSLQPTGYALSKKLTGDVLEFYASRYNIQYSSIVLPNPIGSWDNTRLLEVFYKCWAMNQIPTLYVKDWIRDQIWVQRLSRQWADWLECKLQNQGPSVLRPSGQVQSMDLWIQSFQNVVRGHTGWACSYHSIHRPPLTLRSMPSVLFNTDKDSRLRHHETDTATWEEYLEHLEWRLQQGLL